MGRSRFFAVALALALGPAWASPGHAVPDPAPSTSPSHILLVGHDGGGTPDPAGRFVVVVRDLASNPIPGVPVQVDLSNVTEARLCIQPALPGLTVDCLARSVHGVTDADGRVEFAILGSVLNPGNGTGTGANGARITMIDPTNPFHEIALSSPTVIALDQTGGDGLGVNDIGLFLRDLGGGLYFGRSDYDRDGTVDVGDFSILLWALGRGASVVGCDALSPPGDCGGILSSPAR